MSRGDAPAPPGAAGPVERAMLVAAIAAGCGARLYLLLARPLWADEIFTLTLARRGPAHLLEALRADSGPPLHYLAAHLLLLPFPSPGAADTIVRVLSLAASLLHVPLLLRVGRHLGNPAMGLRAAALYALFPIAADFAAEGRGYALASLLALASLERCLALRERPGLLSAASAGLAAGAAFLTHYLALLPLAGLAALLPGASARARGLLLLAGALSIAIAGPWVPVALSQPEGAMEWVKRDAHRVSRLAIDLVTGTGGLAGESAPLALAVPVLLAAAVVLQRPGAGSRLPLAALGLALASLAALEGIFGTVILPDRTAMMLLPLVALVYAGHPPRGRIAFAIPLLVAAVGLALHLPAASRPILPGAVAEFLLPAVREGRTIVAVGTWGPELDYRLHRAGAAGAVRWFPREMEAHPGWYSETGLDPAAAGAEARDLVRSLGRAPGTLFALPPGSKASAALLGEIVPLGARLVKGSPYLEVWELPAAPPGDGDAPPPAPPPGRTAPVPSASGEPSPRS